MRIIALLLFCIYILSFYQVPDINYAESGFDDLYLVRKITKGIREYYSAMLWVRIDEFYHIKRDFRQHIDKQIGMLEMMHGLTPENEVAVIYLSYMYSKYYKEYDRAIKVLDSFIEKFPRHPKIHKVLGELGYINLLYLNDLDNAEQALYAALQSYELDTGQHEEDALEYLYPGNYMRLLAVVYDRKGDEEKAVFYLGEVNRLSEEGVIPGGDAVDSHPVYTRDKGVFKDEHKHIHKHHSDHSDKHDGHMHHHHHHHTHFRDKFIWQKD